MVENLNFFFEALVKIECIIASFRLELLNHKLRLY